MAATYFAAFTLYTRSTYISRLPYTKLILGYAIWVFIAAIRGALIAENYWEYKSLIQGTASVLMPLLIWPLASPTVLGKTLSFWMRIAVPLFALFAYLLSSDAYGFYLAPLVLFLLLLPLLKFWQQAFILALGAIVILANLDARSNILRFSIPLLFAGPFYFRNYIGARVSRVGFSLFFLLPPTLLLLGSSGIFNVFRMQDYVRPESIGLSTDNYKTVTADTRTFIYDEVWQSAKCHAYIWTGRSLARGYDSEYFGNNSLDLGIGKKERYGSEVGMMNIFTWLGIPGALLYSAIFLAASHMAINQSASFSLKLVGLYVAFRWAFSWVEEGAFFGISYFALWMLVAICFSPQFRAMTDTEIRSWIRALIPTPIRWRGGESGEA